jgi:hypothetical protein
MRAPHRPGDPWPGFPHAPLCSPRSSPPARAPPSPSPSRPPTRPAPRPTPPATPPHPATPRAPTRGAPAPAAAGGLFLVDASGAEVGALVRRGSDDSTAGRAIYDTVTVFHPDSGVFFDITMTDATPLPPATTFFTGANCATPVGITAGGCPTCRAAHASAFLHDGAWWRVVSGAAREPIANGSTRAATAGAACVPHTSSNSPAFPVEPLPPPTPPTTFAAPLRFVWR